MKIANFDIQIHTFEHFRLDGGSMFGSVPKNLWAKLISPDEQNRIPLATNCLVINDGKNKILIDVGNGSKWTDKLRNIYAIEELPTSSLVEPKTITHIILTHLHFDHAGGISYYNTERELTLRYPNAQVFLQKSNFENALNPTLKERASYLKENVEILKNAKLILLDGEKEIFPGISVKQINGHTVGQQYVRIDVGSETILFATDLIPTSHHLPLPFHLGYDVCAQTVMQEKEEFLVMAMQRNAIIIFEHDITIPAARIGKNEKGHYYAKQPVTF